MGKELASMLKRRAPAAANVTVLSPQGTKSNSVSLVLYDSRCSTCLGGGLRCSPRKGVCYYREECYAPGVQHPTDPCAACDGGGSGIWLEKTSETV